MNDENPEDWTWL